MFVINCKNYEEISGDKIIQFIKTAEKISKKYKIKIAIAPPQHLVGLVSKSNIPILAQHVDVSKVGSTTGFIVPELLKKSKVAGSLINHSEHRISPKEISLLVPKLRELKMISILCVKDVSKYLMIFISAGAILWLVYGFVVSDIFIIGTNLAAIVLMMTVLAMKKRYDKIKSNI